MARGVVATSRDDPAGAGCGVAGVAPVDPGAGAEDTRYLGEQLITCIGNKRALLPLIGEGLGRVRSRLGRGRLRILDAFAGSGVVSRFFKRHASELVSNDLERYAEVIGSCYLANRSELDTAALRDAHAALLAGLDRAPVTDGIVRRLYAPADDSDIRPGERVFYSAENAVRIDTWRRLIGELPAEQRAFFLGPLLAGASVHTNTSGVFKGFYKNRAGVGQFGGEGRHALGRILGRIELPFPVFSGCECPVTVRREDANTLVRRLGGLDVAYFDPPYNQHPYGSNYFMLNLIVANAEPERVSRVSGIPPDWNRSRYNRAGEALGALDELIAGTDASHVLVSSSSEGFLSGEGFARLLAKHGSFEVIERRYAAFRGSRNLRGRAPHVTERLFVLERS